MSEFQKCPVGFIDIGGICVPKKRVVRKSDNYQSLFGKDSAIHNVPDDIQGGSDDVEYDEAGQEATDTIVDNTFSKNGEEGEWMISSDGVISLIYDNGEQEFIQPDEYADFLTNDDYTFGERIMPFLIPYITPEINLEIFQAGQQKQQDQLIADVGYDSRNFIGTPSGNQYYYLDTNGEQHTGTYNIIRGEGPNDGTVRLVDANGRVSTYTVAEYNDLLKSQNTIFSNQFYDDVGEYTDVSQDEAEPDTIEYREINSFSYMDSNGRTFQGIAHLYDDRVIIFDEDGNQIVDALIDYNIEGEPNKFSVSYNGLVIVYNSSGQIRDVGSTGIPLVPTIPDDDEPDEPDEPDTPPTIPDTPPDTPSPIPEELDYQVIENFTYRKDGESVTGGTAHLYDNQIIIYDSNGRRVAISPVTHWEGDSYLTVYSGEAVIYSGTSGQIQGMPSAGTLPPERLIDTDVDAEEDGDVDDEE